MTQPESVTGRDEVEVADEALIRHWPRLRAATPVTSGIIRARGACEARSALISGTTCARTSSHRGDDPVGATMRSGP